MKSRIYILFISILTAIIAICCIEKVNPSNWVKETTIDNMEEQVQAAFEVWKSFDQNIEMFFSNDQELELSDLINIYSRHCMSRKLTDNLTEMTPENIGDLPMSYIGSTFFRCIDLKDFAKQYFEIEFEDYLLEDCNSYITEVDSFLLAPTPPQPINIKLESYSVYGNIVEIVVSYESEEIKKGVLTVLVNEKSFKFKSFEIQNR